MDVSAACGSQVVYDGPRHLRTYRAGPGSQAIAFASQASPFGSQAIEVASEADAFASQAIEVASEADAFASQAIEVASEADAFASQANPFGSEALAFASQAGPFGSEASAILSPTGRDPSAMFRDSKAREVDRKESNLGSRPMTPSSPPPLPVSLVFARGTRLTLAD
jgi:hypothetical protein